MPYVLKVVPCHKSGCVNEIVLPYSIPLRTRHSPDRSAKGDPYLDVACPQCGHVFRYTPDMIRPQVYDGPDPYQLPAQMIWLGVWLKCAAKNCASHVLVESVAPPAATRQYVDASVARWQVDDGVSCYAGDAVLRPLKIMWDSISDVVRR